MSKRGAGGPLAAYRAAVAADSPISFYYLDEASGTNAADEIGSNDMTHFNGPTLDVDGALSGSRAVTYNGSNEYTLDTSFSSSTAPLSMECFVKTTTAAISFILSLSNSTNDQYYVCEINRIAGKAASYVRNGSFSTAKHATGSTTINDGNWHHIVVVFESDTSRKIYIDGALEDTNTNSVTSPTCNRFGPAVLNRGGAYGFGSYLAGTVDEIAFYDYALTASQVSSHYAASGL